MKKIIDIYVCATRTRTKEVFLNAINRLNNAPMDNIEEKGVLMNLTIFLVALAR